MAEIIDFFAQKEREHLPDYGTADYEEMDENWFGEGEQLSGRQLIDEQFPDEEPAADRAKCRELSCFANSRGCCTALWDTDFGNRRCPFYKTKEELLEGQLDALQRLVEKGRFDLIEKYRGTLEELGILDCGDSFFSDHQDTVDYLAQLMELERKLKEEDGTLADFLADSISDEWDEEEDDGGI